MNNSFPTYLIEFEMCKRYNLNSLEEITLHLCCNNSTGIMGAIKVREFDTEMYVLTTYHHREAICQLKCDTTSMIEYI